MCVNIEQMLDGNNHLKKTLSSKKLQKKREIERIEKELMIAQRNYDHAVENFMICINMREEGVFSETLSNEYLETSKKELEKACGMLNAILTAHEKILVLF
jgi:hypothetical protein